MALYSSTRVAQIIQMPRSMVEHVHYVYSTLARGGFVAYDDFKQAFLPMHRIRMIDLEFRLKFDVVISSEDIRLFKIDKQKCLEKRIAFDQA